MRKIWITLFLALGLAVSARAQEVTYALPVTTLTLKVEVQQESFYAGPYASYAQKFLNLDVRDTDEVTSTVTAVELIPGIEADPKALFTCDAENAAMLALSAQGLIALQNKADANRLSWRFLPPTRSDFEGSITSPNKLETRITYKKLQGDDGVIQIPVEHKVKQAKSLEDKAAEAAEMVLKVRKDRMNIVSGDTDASYSGEAMSAAIKELDRIEEEYLALFRGRSVIQTNVSYFDVIPNPQTKNHRYLAFRLTDNGPVSDGNKGIAYYLEVEPGQYKFPEEEAPRPKGKNAQIRYRIPVVCDVTLTCDGKRLLEARVPVYQLGVESYLTQYK